MKTTARLFLAGMAFFAASAGSALAVTINVDWLNANVDVNGTTDGDGSQPVASANATDTLTSHAGVDTLNGTAIQNENGFSFLELTVDHNGYEGLAATGDITEINNRATAIRKITFTNDTAVAQQGTFSFSISGIKLETFHAGGGPTDPEAKVEFSLGASNGETFDASMTLRATYPPGGQNHEIVDANQFSGSVVTSDCYAGHCQTGTVNVDPLSRTISLGLLDPGQSVSVTTTFDIYTVFNATELGAQARAQDPGSYSWSFTPLTSVAAVPLPAGAWLMLSAMGLTAALRRRKST